MTIHRIWIHNHSSHCHTSPHGPSHYHTQSSQLQGHRRHSWQGTKSPLQEVPERGTCNLEIMDDFTGLAREGQGFLLYIIGIISSKSSNHEKFHASTFSVLSEFHVLPLPLPAALLGMLDVQGAAGWTRDRNPLQGTTLPRGTEDGSQVRKNRMFVDYTSLQGN